MSDSPLLQQLMSALRCLPGVGPKTAQRMAFHLLQQERDGARQLSSVLLDALERIGHCQRCRTLTESTICEICANKGRNASLLCVVENPADLLVLEQSGSYRGYYFVLMGRLSPLDGIGPADLGMDRLEAILDEGEVEEIILATNATVEGEVTAHYISELASVREIGTSRIAQGIPMGGELEYVDKQTVAHAIESRTSY